MKFNMGIPRYLSTGVTKSVSPVLIQTIWTLVEKREEDIGKEIDSIQLFTFNYSQEKQYIKHIQENPEITSDFAIDINSENSFGGNVYVVHNGEYIVMVLGNEL